MTRLALAAALACAACQVELDPADTVESIVGGSADTEHDSVVAVVGRRDTCASRESTICSGTLVGPRLVLTAAHCLDGLQPQELEVVEADDVAQPDRILAVWDAWVHPDYDPAAAPEESFDAALLVLEDAATGAPAALPDGSPAELVDGASVRIVGFGRTAPAETSGRRMSATATVTSAGAIAVVTDGDGGVPCGGDSGGAVFIDTTEGERLAGVIKASGPDCAELGVSLRVDAILDAFITPSLPLAADVTSSGRPPLDADASLCGDACEVAADCPLGMLCLPERDGMHCGYRAGRVADYGDRCNPDDGDACVPIGQGSERDCRVRVPCDTTGNDDAGGGFCRTAPGNDARGLALVVLTLGIARRRRRRSRDRTA